MAAIDQLSGLMNIISSVQGKSQTQKSSGNTTTQQTLLSDEAVNEQIKKILSGSGGVRDVGNSARNAGLYNSTSEDLLLGNLYARAAASGEIARAPTVSTTTGQTVKTETPGVGIGTTIGTVAGAALLGKALSAGGDIVGTGISDLLGGVFGSNGKKTNLDDLGGNATGGINIGSDGGVSASASVGSGGGWSGDSFGTQMGLGLNGIDQGQVGASGNVQSDSGSFDLLGSVGSALSGFFSGGGLGGLVGAVTGGTGASNGSGGSSGGSVICTALKDRGLLDRKLHAAGEKYLNALPLEVKVGYQSWAIEIADKIAEGHEGWTAICGPVARSRTSLLASSGSFIYHLKFPLGTLTKFIGEPVCGMIGKRILSQVSQYKGV